MTSHTGGRPGLALVTGATGYVGGLLVPELLERGWSVRVLSRRRSAVRDQPWGDRVEVVEGDATDGQDVRAALAGVEVAYYLMHSMDGAGDFVERDKAMAHTFAEAATSAGVGRIVYLSGLHPPGSLSPHLASRVEVGRILLESGVPTAVLQAGVVLGDGSASFDMLRHLTERLPAFVAPKWLRNRIQPIAAHDVVHYLAEAAGLDPRLNRTFDIGGPEVLTYAEMMRGYARVTGLGRLFIATLPVLTPGLASHWVGLVTPVRSAIAKPLVGSLIHDAVCHEQDLAGLVPAPSGGPTSFEDAIRRATRDIDPMAWRRRLGQAAGTVGAAAVVGSLLT
ncbi:MAG: NAD(P)H-binding protein, partial [Nostocoides sp.]